MVGCYYLLLGNLSTLHYCNMGVILEFQFPLFRNRSIVVGHVIKWIIELPQLESDHVLCLWDLIVWIICALRFEVFFATTNLPCAATWALSICFYLNRYYILLWILNIYYWLDNYFFLWIIVPSFINSVHSTSINSHMNIIDSLSYFINGIYNGIFK